MTDIVLCPPQVIGVSHVVTGSLITGTGLHRLLGLGSAFCVGWLRFSVLAFFPVLVKVVGLCYL